MTTLLAHILVLGLPGAAIFALVCWLTKRRRIWFSVLFGTGMAISVYLFCIYLYNNPRAQVNIIQPVDQSVVNGAWMNIEGTVSPPDARVHVLVHPDQDLYWWVQKEAIRGIKGAWKAEVSLGSLENGKRTHFQIIAVASTIPILLESICNLALVEGEQLKRPPALPSTEIVTIWREQ